MQSSKDRQKDLFILVPALRMGMHTFSPLTQNRVHPRFKHPPGKPPKETMQLKHSTTEGTKLARKTGEIVVPNLRVVRLKPVQHPRNLRLPCLQRPLQRSLPLILQMHIRIMRQQDL